MSKGKQAEDVGVVAVQLPVAGVVGVVGFVGFVGGIGAGSLNCIALPPAAFASLTIVALPLILFVSGSIYPFSVAALVKSTAAVPIPANSTTNMAALFLLMGDLLASLSFFINKVS